MPTVTMISESKKRKHRPSQVPDATITVSSKKNEKRQKMAPSLEQDARSLQKGNQNSPQDKAKSHTLASDLPSDFCTVSASLVLSIPPVFASNLRVGAEEMLDSMVMRYIPPLQGVLLAHSNIRFMSQTASIHGDCPFAVCNVCFDATIWAPRISMKLTGTVNVCSPDHVSLLVHRIFNVSIPRHHIPKDQWVFEYGPAENDPEFGQGRNGGTSNELKDAVDGVGSAEIIDSTTLEPSRETRETESSGRWVHHLTGFKLGDPDGYVEFTVIGLTVANEMLSLQGSIQPDPFSPEHNSHPDKEASFRRSETPEIEARSDTCEEEGEWDDEDEDGFARLARLTDKAQATQKAKRAQEKAERLEKRKRRENQGGENGEGIRHGKKTKRKRIKEAAS